MRQGAWAVTVLLRAWWRPVGFKNKLTLWDHIHIHAFVYIVWRIWHHRPKSAKKGPNIDGRKTTPFFAPSYRKKAHTDSTETVEWVSL